MARPNDCWYPAFSPDGAYLAYGSETVGVSPVSVSGGQILLGTEIPLGAGISPAWFNQSGTMLLWYDRASSLKVAQPVVFAPLTLTAQGFNSYHAGGGVYAGFVNGQIESSLGNFGGRMSVPAGPTVDQSGRIVSLNLGQTAVSARIGGATVTLVSGGVYDRPHIATQGAVWQTFSGSRRETYGRLGTGTGFGAIQRVQASADSEFWSVPVDTPAGPYILSHDSTTLFLRKWGGTALLVIGVGVFDFPTAVYSSTLGGGGFLVAWSAGGALGTAFVAVPEAALEAPVASGGTVGTPPPPGDTPPAVSLAAERPAYYVAPRKATYPHVPQVTDLHAQQSLKLLWDRVFEIGERLDTGDIFQRFAGLASGVDAVNTRIDSQQTQLIGNPVESRVTTIPGGDPGIPPPGPGPGPTPGPDPNGWTVDQWRDFVFTQIQQTGVGPTVTEAAMEVLDPIMRSRGAQFQRDSAGTIRPRLYLPTGDPNFPYTRPVDLGALSGPWLWIPRF